MTTMSLAFEAKLAQPHDRAIETVTAALKSEGFGVLTRIDAHTTFREKLGVEFRPYSILGACNPPLAHRVLSHRAEAGLLLPCNVTVEADGSVNARVPVFPSSPMHKARSRPSRGPTLRR